MTWSAAPPSDQLSGYELEYWTDLDGDGQRQENETLRRTLPASQLSDEYAFANSTEQPLVVKVRALYERPLVPGAWSSDVTVQRDTTVAAATLTSTTDEYVRGTAEPGATIVLNMGEQTYETTADATGAWEIGFAAPLAAGSYESILTTTDQHGNTLRAQHTLKVPVIVIPSVKTALLQPELALVPEASQQLLQPQQPATAPVVLAATQQRSSRVEPAAAVQEAAASPRPTAAVVASERGWVMFGVTWYWWIMIAAAGVVGGFFVRCRLLRPTTTEAIGRA